MYDNDMARPRCKPNDEELLRGASQCLRDIFNLR